jgi:hypothetical protein
MFHVLFLLYLLLLMAFLTQEDKSFRYKVIIVVMVLILFWLFVEYVRLVYKRQYQIGLKKQAWIQEIESIEVENDLLPKQYQYYRTDYFLKKEAKRKLNKREVDEKVLVVLGENSESAQLIGGVSDQVNIPSAWWEYIFGRSAQQVYEEVPK